MIEGDTGGTNFATIYSSHQRSHKCTQQWKLHRRPPVTTREETHSWQARPPSRYPKRHRQRQAKRSSAGRKRLNCSELWGVGANRRPCQPSQRSTKGNVFSAKRSFFQALRAQRNMETVPPRLLQTTGEAIRLRTVESTRRNHQSR